MITTRAASPADRDTLDRLFREIFVATFGHLYGSQNLALFLGGFTPERWDRELADPAFAFRIAELDGVPVGYAKVGPMDLPGGEDDRAIELYHLYVVEEARGTGLAAELMDWVVAQARALGGDALYLSVFVDNHRARRFYERLGFATVGPYAFIVGDQADEDIIMRLAL